jgi:hypothetical protein
MVRIQLFLLALVYLCCMKSVLSSVISRKVTSKTSSSPTTGFCKAFNAECYHQALHGKTGHIQVVHECKRVGKKYSSLYDFGCKTKKKDLTAAVIKAIGSGYTVSSAVEITAYETDTVTDTATSISSKSSTTHKTNTVDTSSTSTTTTGVVQTNTDTIPTTLTTVIPVTTTTTATSTVTSTSLATATEYTSTYTTYSFSTDAVPVTVVAVHQAASRKRTSKVLDAPEFCSAFDTGCSTECLSLKSTPKHVICQLKTVNHYSLACQCKNGKSETQHALLAVLDQEHISSVSTVTTSTLFTTVTSTNVVPTTILSTSTDTVTNTIPVTKTYTSSSTATQTTTSTGYTGLSVTVATAIPTVSVTVPATTTVATVTTASTTDCILAPTGALQAFAAVGGASVGYVGYPSSSNFFKPDASYANAIQFMAVKDTNSDYYQLQLTDGSGNAFISETAIKGNDFSQVGAYAYTYPGSPSLCGSAGTTVGPAAGFTLDADNTAVFDALSEWVNPGQTSPGQYVWIVRSYTDSIYQAATYDGYSTEFASNANSQSYGITLQFPA